MPLRSQAQRRFLRATSPELARRFEDHTAKGVKLPKKVRPGSKLSPKPAGLVKAKQHRKQAQAASTPNLPNSAQPFALNLSTILSPHGPWDQTLAPLDQKRASHMLSTVMHQITHPQQPSPSVLDGSEISLGPSQGFTEHLNSSPINSLRKLAAVLGPLAREVLGPDAPVVTGPNAHEAGQIMPSGLVSSSQRDQQAPNAAMGSPMGPGPQMGSPAATGGAPGMPNQPQLQPQQPPQQAQLTPATPFNPQDAQTSPAAFAAHAADTPALTNQSSPALTTPAGSANTQPALAQGGSVPQAQAAMQGFLPPPPTPGGLAVGPGAGQAAGGMQSPSANPINNFGPISMAGDVNGNAGLGVPNSPVPSKMAALHAMAVALGDGEAANAVIDAYLKEAAPTETIANGQPTATPGSKDFWKALIPVLLGGAAGTAYGAYKSPGGSTSRGALIGGLGGLGAGGGFSAANTFLDSEQARHFPSQSTMSAAALLGSGALGLHGGLSAGRAVADYAGLHGRDDDEPDNDLAEIDLLHKSRRMLPGPIADLFKRGAHDEKAAQFGMLQGSSPGTGMTPQGGTGPTMVQRIMRSLLPGPKTMSGCPTAPTVPKTVQPATVTL